MLTHRATTILGDVPQGWGREFLAALLARQGSGDWGSDSGELAVRVLRSTNFTNRGALDFSDVAMRFFPTKAAAKIGLQVHDLLLERSGGGPTQPVGRVGFIQENLPDYWFSNFVQLIRADENQIDPQFLGWLLLELHQCGVVERLQHQTTQMRNLDFRDYLRVYLPKPPKGVQKVISSILAAVSQMRSAAEGRVAAAHKLKTALMQELFVTGVPGRHQRFVQTRIGTFPEGWQVSRVFEIVASPIYNGVSPQSRPNPPGTPILNVGCISSGLCDPQRVTYVDLDQPASEDMLARRGDFFVLRGNGNRDYVATGGLLAVDPPSGCVFSDLLIKIPFHTDVTAPGYMELLWQSPSFLRALQSRAVSGSGLWKIGLREIRRHEFPRPPKTEQAEIVGMLSAADACIAASEAELDALDRLRRSLLQNLLTGKVLLRPPECEPDAPTGSTLSAPPRLAP